MKELVPEAVVVYEGYAPDTKDYRTILTKVKRSNPDADRDLLARVVKD